MAAADDRDDAQHGGGPGEPTWGNYDGEHRSNPRDRGYHEGYEGSYGPTAEEQPAGEEQRLGMRREAPAAQIGGTRGRYLPDLGMEVVGLDGRPVGRVREVGATHFLVGRPDQRDLSLPLDAVREVTGDRVMLDVPAAQADRASWPSSGRTG